MTFFNKRLADTCTPKKREDDDDDDDAIKCGAHFFPGQLTKGAIQQNTHTHIVKYKQLLAMNFPIVFFGTLFIFIIIILHAIEVYFHRPKVII